MSLKTNAAKVRGSLNYTQQPDNTIIYNIRCTNSCQRVLVIAAIGLNGGS
jgi:hypothetical protein